MSKDKCSSCNVGLIIFLGIFVLIFYFLLFHKTDAQIEKEELKRDIKENPVEVKCVEGVKMYRDRSIEYSEFKQLVGPNGLPIMCR